jgi:hypothetical protein
MKRMILVALMASAMAGCDSSINPEHPAPAKKQYWHWEHYDTLDRLHDDEKHVTCWRFSPQSLSCIPDSQLAK